MSSRVLRSADAAVVSTVAWRSVGGNAEANAAQASRPQRQDIGRPHGLDAESGESEHAMQARLDTARQQGHAEGEAAGLARAGQRLDPVIANLSAAINELAQQRARL